MKRSVSRRTRWAVLASAAALLAAGCASASDDDGEPRGPLDYSTRLVNVTEPSGEPVRGGTLRVAEYSEARVLDPTVTFPTGSTSGAIMVAIYDTLVRYDHTTDSFVPQLAESVESEDDVTWTIRLREGVKFHDGTDLDADAVAASIERYIAAYGLNSLLLKQEVTSIEAIDPLTVEMVMANPWPRFPVTLSNGAGMILAPAAYADPESFTPIGAGPFTFASYAPSERTVVAANEDYWNGRPHLDSIEFVVLGPEATTFDSFKSGGVDVAFLRAPRFVDEALEDGTAGMVNYVGMANNYWINTREGRPGEDKRVRQAIALAFDPEIWMQRTADGAGTPTKLLLGPDSLWAPGVDPLPTDPEAARELLDEAKADGYDGRITLIALADRTAQAGALAMQAMLEAIGFDVTIDQMSSVADQTQRLYVEQDFDLATAGTSIHNEDVFGRLVSSLNVQSPTNLAGYDSEEMNTLVRELQAIDDPAAAAEVLTEIEQLWAEDAPGVSIHAGGVFNVWQPEVHGIKPSSEALLHFEEAWIER